MIGKSGNIDLNRARAYVLRNYPEGPARTLRLKQIALARNLRRLG
jgi:hypothetical protein